ncbi:hypothetical protein C2G38_2113249, partial [Gigaspora rosea]
IYSLYSCTLVSRYWCKMSNLILWQDPFSFEQKKPLFISKYFSSLGEDEKFILKGFGINTEFSETLFDYARFLKVLDLSNLKSNVKKWIDLQQVVPKAYYTTSLYRIMNLLIKLFIRPYSLGQNKQFFSRLQDLTLSLMLFSTENATNLLRILEKNATKVSALKLDNFHSSYDPQLFEALRRIIKSQEQLRKFSIVGKQFPAEFYGI